MSSRGRALEFEKDIYADVRNPDMTSSKAFRNGKLDLTQVEAVSELIAAETEAQRLLALRGVAKKPRLILIHSLLTSIGS